DVVERIHRLTALEALGARAAVDAYAVDVDDRVVPLGYRVVAAEQDRAAGAGLAGVLEHGCPRHAPGQQVLGVPDRRVLDLPRRHPGQARAELPRALLARGGDHDLVEVERRRLQLEVHLERLAGHDLDLALL